MVGYLGKHTNLPSDSIGQTAQATVDRMWGPIPGITVSAWNGRTVDVQPLYRPMHNGQPTVMPVLFDVPVDQPMTANGGMTFPIPVGTPVMLSPMMRAMDDWEEGGEATATDARAFHISSMRASISGGESLAHDIPAIDLENFHVRFNADGSFGLKGSPDGKLQIMGAEGDIVSLIADFMELVAGDELQINYGSSEGSGHALKNRAALTAIAAKIRGMVL